MEWLEVTGRTVDIAVDAGLAELGVSSRDDVTIEVLQEPSKGFLGMGRVDAIVKITKKAASQRRKRRRRKKGEGQARQPEQPKAGKSSKQGPRTTDTKGSTARKPAARSERTEPKRAKEDRNRRPTKPERKPETTMEDVPVTDINEQAQVATAFLEGLVKSFGLEGEVASRIEDDVLYLDVSGDQTEALVGPKGSVMQAILELTRTVMQRKTHGAPRLRLDIAGYGERRREALRIYAGRLAERVLEEGGEFALEPMNPADRKVIHDAIAEYEGVKTFSEGEDPHRRVVLTLGDGVRPKRVETDDNPPETDAADANGNDDASDDQAEV